MRTDRCIYLHLHTYCALTHTAHFELWLFFPTGRSVSGLRRVVVQNPMFFLMEGMGAKTIQGSNHRLNHIGFLLAKTTFNWESIGAECSVGWDVDWECLGLSVPFKHARDGKYIHTEKYAKNTVYYTYGPKMVQKPKCGTMDVAHPRQKPYF